MSKKLLSITIILSVFIISQIIRPQSAAAMDHEWELYLRAHSKIPEEEQMLKLMRKTLSNFDAQQLNIQKVKQEVNKNLEQFSIRISEQRRETERTFQSILLNLAQLYHPKTALNYNTVLELRKTPVDIPQHCTIITLKELTKEKEFWGEWGKEEFAKDFMKLLDFASKKYCRKNLRSIHEYPIEAKYIIKNNEQNILEHKVAEIFIAQFHRVLETPLEFEEIIKVSTVIQPRGLIYFFKTLIESPLPEHHTDMYREMLTLSQPSTNHELFLSPHVHTIDRKPSEFVLSLLLNKCNMKFSNSSNESIADSGRNEFMHLNLYETSIIAQDNSDESNQETNGTTDPKKHTPKSTITTDLSLISDKSNSSNSEESLVSSTKEQHVKKQTLHWLGSPFKNDRVLEDLLHNDGACNNAPNTEASKEESNGDEPNLFLIYDSITYHTRKLKKGFTSRRPIQKKIELADDI